MMKMLEEAIIYATIMHQGKVRKFQSNPYILHPIEVAQILSTMTDDEEVISAGILHDIVEDTDGTLAEIEKRFGKRVAELVDSGSENKYPDEDRVTTWKRRKEESLLVLKNSEDIGVQMLWLADKLANIRSLAGIFSEKEAELWTMLNQSDPALQCWYYSSVAEIVELQLNKTGAFKEFIKHINFIWPGTFDVKKTRYRKYREVSVDGCRVLGWGAKGTVYRYNDELIVKVFNHNNTYSDVEREVALSRKAFVLGIPTAISFGIVSVVKEGIHTDSSDASKPAGSPDQRSGAEVGNQYGAMYELLDAETISDHIARNPERVEVFALIMSQLAHTIHDITVTEEEGFPEASGRLLGYVHGGIALEDEPLTEKCMKLIETLPSVGTLVHGDFHTSNVFLYREEPLLIDMDRIATGHPIVEISDLYYFYVVLGNDDPSVVEKFMGFSYETAKKFFDCFLKYYLDTADENLLREVKEKAAFLCYIRMINKVHKKTNVDELDRKLIRRYIEKISELSEKLDTLAF